MFQKLSIRRVFWEKRSSRVTFVLNAKNVVSQIRGNEELEQVFGSKAFLCLHCFQAFQSYWDKKQQLMTAVARILQVIPEVPPLEPSQLSKSCWNGYKNISSLFNKNLHYLFLFWLD